MSRPVVFKPCLEDVLIVGLGPGMQAKYLHRHMPDTRVVVVEIDAQVVSIAVMMQMVAKKTISAKDAMRATYNRLELDDMLNGKR